MTGRVESMGTCSCLVGKGQMTPFLSQPWPVECYILDPRDVEP